MTQAQLPVLALRGVSKRFGETAALTDMSLALYPGEVHAVVGENGAGKSTMIKIMTGIHAPSAGHVEIDGAAVTLGGPHDARERGVTAMYQEPMVFPDLDVAENIFISSTREGLVQRRGALHLKAEALVARIGMALDLDRLASQLSLAEQQAVEIARALSQDVRVLIMDEPTAALSAHEAAQLRRVARTLANEGVAVVYISHRLEEIFEIGDRVTVIRDGEHISTRPIGETSRERMIAEMVGREVDHFFEHVPSRARPQVMLEVAGLGREGVFQDISFTLQRGEILAMAGLIGARRTDVALALFGIAPASTGTIVYKGERLDMRSPRQAIEHGIAYVSEDRRKLGLAMPMAISANISLATLGAFLTPAGLLRRRHEREIARAFRERLNIRARDVEMPVGDLSGGNQQKVMLAKWLNLKPDLLIFDEPTRGIDVGAKAEVHTLIRDFVAAGGAALVISSDLPEVLAMGDRILVMREGRQMGILANEEANQERIMALATGQGAPEEVAA
ncbi:MAG: sugar ABC transporter ATP-binding protein [Acuticoccus sp.]